MDIRLERAFPWIATAVLIAAGLLAYANTFDGGWVWDDASSVLLHKHVQEPARLWYAAKPEAPGMASLPVAMLGAFGQLFREDQHAFGRGQGNFYRPLLSCSFAIDYLLSASPDLFLPAAASTPAPQPPVLWFHLQSLAWHVMAAMGLFAVLSRLGCPRPVRLAVPLLWVVHPLHTEAVAYISGRADMMSGTFLFWGLFLGLSPAEGWRRLAAIAGSTLCFALGLLSKEATLIYPAVLALALLVRAGGESVSAGRTTRWLKTLSPAFPALAVLATYILLRATVLSFAKAAPSQAAPFSQRLYETAQSFGLYIELLFMPTGLHMERTLDGVGWGAALFGGMAFVLVLAAGIIAFLRGSWRLSLGVALFLLCWLPISGLFPLNAPLAEHWMYVPMAGFWLALAEGLLLLPAPAPRIASAAAAALWMFFLFLTHQRNEDWHDNVLLFQATLRENPRTMRVHYNLAVTFSDLVHNNAGAIRHYGATASLAAPGSDDQTDALLSEVAALLDSARPNEALNLLPKLGPAMKAGAPAWAQAEAVLDSVRALLALGRYGEAAQLVRSAGNNPAVQTACKPLLAGAPLSERLHLPGMLPLGR